MKFYALINMKQYFWVKCYWKTACIAIIIKLYILYYTHVANYMEYVRVIKWLKISILGINIL